MRSAVKIASIAVTALLLCGCDVLKGKQTTSQYVDDASITARAKAALVSDNRVSATDFNIDTYQGNVTITGVAKSAAEAQHAEADIRKVPGVKSVKNATRVASAGSESSQE